VATKDDVCAVQTWAGMTGLLSEKPTFVQVGSAYWIGIQRALDKLGTLTKVDELRVAVGAFRTAAEAFYTKPSRESMDQLGDTLRSAIQCARITRNAAVPLGWGLRLRLALDMARGVAHLHGLQTPIVHRDLKTPNVFVCTPLAEVAGRDELSLLTDEAPLAKVADFGLSARLFGLDSLKVGAGADDAIANLNPLWAAPEVLARAEYGKPADVYAMGIMLWELVSREAPFHTVDLSSLASLVKEGERPMIPRRHTVSICRADSPGCGARPRLSGGHRVERGGRRPSARVGMLACSSPSFSWSTCGMLASARPRWAELTARRRKAGLYCGTAGCRCSRSAERVHQ